MQTARLAKLLGKQQETGIVSLKLLQTVGASILAFTSKGKVLVERDSASGLACHAQNRPVNRPGASFV
jgi:hypothetical protein